VFARPNFRRRPATRARSQAALPFRDHQPFTSRADSTLQKRLPAHVHPAITPSWESAQIRVLRGGLISSLLRIVCRRSDTKWPDRTDDILSIGVLARRISLPHDRLLCHSFFSAILGASASLLQFLFSDLSKSRALRRSRACKAELFQFASGPRAIQRAARRNAADGFAPRRDRFTVEPLISCPMFAGHRLTAFHKNFALVRFRSMTRRNPRPGIRAASSL